MLRAIRQEKERRRLEVERQRVERDAERIRERSQTMASTSIPHMGGKKGPGPFTGTGAVGVYGDKRGSTSREVTRDGSPVPAQGLG